MLRRGGLGRLSREGMEGTLDQEVDLDVNFVLDAVLARRWYWL